MAHTLILGATVSGKDHRGGNRGQGGLDYRCGGQFLFLCFVHPAKKDIRSNLNLITDKGNIYSFTLEDVTDQAGDPDLKVIVQPSDQSSIVASAGPAQYVPVTQVTAMENQLQGLQSHITQVVDEYKAAYPMELKFDYTFKALETPFNVPFFRNEVSSRAARH